MSDRNEQKSLHQSLAYRPDIDGLRALAVLPVVLFHLGVDTLGGGFAGVDVFFVISGFLIASIIQRDLDKGCFSLATFYERRVLRLLPALFTVLIMSSVLAWFNLLPNDFEYFGRTLMATASFSSNILFWLNSGYFAPDSEYVVLLHTWSLAVEEQFYIFFPLLLMVLPTKSRALRAMIILILIGLSFFLALVLVSSSPSFAFYNLPTRAWELLAGALLALVRLPAFNTKAMQLLSAAGVICIALAVFVCDDGRSFPGLPALLPVLGAVFVIYTGQHGTFAGQKILSVKPALFFGKISYSLYLWHWPVIVFFKYGAPWELTPLWQCAVFASCTMLAYLSWRFIEQPARTQQKLRGKALLLCALSGCFMFAAFGGIISAKDGFATRFPPDLVRLSAEETPPEFSAIPDFKDLGGYKSVIGDTEAKDAFLVWGDSHTMAAAAGLDLSAKDHNVKGYVVGFHSCFPFVADMKMMSAECNAINREVLDFLQRHKEIKTIVLLARWDAYFDRMEKRVKEGKENHEYPFEYYLGTLFEHFARQDRRVVFVAEVPPAPAQSIRLYLIRQMRYDRNFALYTSLDKYLAEQEGVRSALDTLAKDYAFTRIEPYETICKDGLCPLMGNGQSYYKDDDHISNYGAEHFHKMFEPIFN